MLLPEHRPGLPSQRGQSLQNPAQSHSPPHQCRSWQQQKVSAFLATKTPPDSRPARATHSMSWQSNSCSLSCCNRSSFVLLATFVRSCLTGLASCFRRL